MSPADERRQLVMAAQRRDPFVSDEWFGGEPGARASAYAEKPARRGWTFVAVSAALVAVALGVCWVLASSDSVARWIQNAPDRTATTELTSAPSGPVEATTLPNAVPTTVQPAVVPASPPVLEEAPKAATATPTVAATSLTPVAPPSIPVKALPAAAAAVHHEPAGQTTLRVVETPEPDPTPAPSESE